VRVSSKIVGALAAAPVAGFAAYEKAQSGFKPNPPVPEFDKVIGSMLSGADVVASGSAVLAAFMAGYAIYEMFKPDPATPTDVQKIVETAATQTNARIDEVGGQIVLEGQASEERDKLTHRLVSGELHERVTVAVEADLLDEQQLTRIYEAAAKKLGLEGAQRATENIIEAATRSSDEVQQLLADGKFAEAGEAQRKLAEAGDAEQAQRWRDTASIFVLTSITKAISAYARAVDLDPSDFRTWIELSRLHRAAGSLPEARRTAEAALQHVGDDYDRMVAEGELGDVAVAEGQLPLAARHFTSAMQASRAIADAAPDDLNLQRQLSVIHNKLGDVARAQGDLAGARTAYAASLAIAERLAASDPGNAGWQRDLSVSHIKLGDVSEAQGDLAGAHTAYATSLAIAERLAAADPGNAGWQRDLFISHAKFAQFNEASGDVAGAIREFAAGEAILVALIARVGDHPGFARDLAQVRADIARLRGE
jgi:tetratricopeptide (TPR) repeat protein